MATCNDWKSKHIQNMKFGIAVLRVQNSVVMFFGIFHFGEYSSKTLLYDWVFVVCLMGDVVLFSLFAFFCLGLNIGGRIACSCFCSLAYTSYESSRVSLAWGGSV